MRKLILAVCLIASIVYSYPQQKYNFNVVLDKPEYTNIPKTNKLGNGLALVPIGKIVSKFQAQPLGGTEVILNDYADEIFTNLQSLMFQNNFDSIVMPDMHTGFNYTLIIHYHGELDLTTGQLDDISTIHRGGDVVVQYSSNARYMDVTVPIAFDDMEFTYDYSAKIMGLGPTGGVEGKVTDLTVEATIGFDTKNLVASLDDFQITDAGRITFHFTGNTLIDWLLDLLTDAATLLLKQVILSVVEDVVRGTLETVVDDINEGIGDILNPTTPVPSVDVVAKYFN